MRTTSKIANAVAEKSGIKAAHRHQILKALEKRKRGTCHHLSVWTGIGYHQIGRRMSELEREQKVFAQGKVGFSPSGLPAIVWEIV